ncbi:MAG: TlpA disulfide reductase family protein [Cyclobacteriaceae bacterium]
MPIIPIILFTFLFWGPQISNENFRIISFNEFEEIIDKPSEKLRIYNFWATWCAPCIKEMPDFEKINKELTDVDLVFISMDDGRRPERVTSFIEKKGIASPVLLLDDIDFNRWINKVNENWSGAIPATLFINSEGDRHFHEGQLSEQELRELINQLK